MNAADPLLRLLALKSVLRQGWTRFPLPPLALESVADHSYGVALLVLLLCPPELDRARAIEMALLHDLAEVITGDVIPSDAVDAESKASDEQAALKVMMAPLHWDQTACELLREYQTQESAEARFVKGVDKLDMALQSLVYEDEFAVDLEEFRQSARAALSDSGLLSWLAETEV